MKNQTRINLVARRPDYLRPSSNSVGSKWRLPGESTNLKLSKICFLLPLQPVHCPLQPVQWPHQRIVRELQPTVGYSFPLLCSLCCTFNAPTSLVEIKLQTSFSSWTGISQVGEPGWGEIRWISELFDVDSAPMLISPKDIK